MCHSLFTSLAAVKGGWWQGPGKAHRAELSCALCNMVTGDWCSMDPAAPDSQQLLLPATQGCFQKKGVILVLMRHAAGRLLTALDGTGQVRAA